MWVDVNIFCFSGIIFKYTEASNKAAKPTSLLVFLHPCD